MENLKWEPLQHYTQLALKDEANEISGVYVWGFEYENKFVPYYAGKAAYVYWRLTDHLSGILGGNYSIFKKENLINADFDNSNRLYNAQDIAKKINFIQKRRHEINADINFMIDHFHFTCAPLNDFKSNGAEYEKAVLNKLKGKLINTRYGAHDESLDIGNLFDVLKQPK